MDMSQRQTQLQDLFSPGGVIGVEDFQPPATVVAYDRAGERVMSTIAAVCGRTADFSERVGAALDAALVLLAAEPDLARLLAPRPYGGGEEALLCHRYWRDRFASLLRCAAEKEPEAGTHPFFLEPTLIGGIYFQITRFVLTDRAEQLEDLLPSLREFVLAYYVGPEARLRLA
jgi:hypothetical protein